MSPIRKKNLALLRGVSLANRGDYQTWVFAIAAICLLFITVYSIFNIVDDEQEPERRIEEVALPDFASIADVSEKKRAFFSFLKPFVEQANEDILREREQALKLQQYFERHGRLSSGRLEDLNALLVDYDLSAVESADVQVFAELLLRVDTIPVSLALSQAALESAWGTSRFARQGNNLFGMWCYEIGCGIVPLRRPAGRTYEVAAYSSPRESFYAYVKNLNTNRSYAEMREIRAAHRSNGVEPSGYDLAAGLVRYSQERWEYVEKVRSMISHNRLES